ncbi:Hypothetical predicted protein [Olea europaea subsp. europaea]|uniref:Uncharacterized protein n=1 Tax=Olea europaea subsp. europaea TaxID=158383 RepID=A0A8S0VCL1_OLEEU|nr:Hypothetical predicted protein [Olea europaea subsp. europaea]
MVYDLAVVVCECSRKLTERDGAAAVAAWCWWRQRRRRSGGSTVSMTNKLLDSVVVVNAVVVEMGDVGGAGCGVYGGDLRKWVDAIWGGFCWMRWQR